MNKSTFEEELARHGRLLYTNVGDSMNPLIRQGKDLLVIESPNGRLKKYDIPLYKRDNGQYVLHRIIKVRKNDYIICGDNRWRCEYGITDRHIIGVLTSVVRDGTDVDFSSWQYQLYLLLWCRLFPLRAVILYLKALPRRIERKLKKILRKYDIKS